MEVFSVFATLSLVDMISGPLDRVRRAMRSVEGGVATLGQRMGNLALAMAPVALAAGVMLGAFGMAASKAMAFESAMADVAKVVNFETQSEFQAMNKTVMDMAGRIPMAADGIAAIIAAAGQSGVAKQDLAEFAEQAAKMGVAFDLTGDQAGKMMSDWRAGMNLTLPQVYSLADAVNHLSNNMNATAPALGEVIQRVGYGQWRGERGMGRHQGHCFRRVGRHCGRYRGLRGVPAGWDNGSLERRAGIFRRAKPL